MHLRGDHVTAVLQVMLLHVQVTLCALPSAFRHGGTNNQLQRGDHHNHLDQNNRDTTASALNTRRSLPLPGEASGAAPGSDLVPQGRRRFYYKSRGSAWNHDTPDPAGLDSRQHRWATAAYNFVHSLDCQDVFFTTLKECRALVAVPKHVMNVHVALPSPYGKFRTTIPEESGPLGSGLHDAVLVVDPYPRASFGHLVVVFFVDGGVSSSHCHNMGGVYLDGDECMHLALRRRCRNALERLSRRRNYARRCEINFLPVVHLSTRGSRNHHSSTSSSSHPSSSSDHHHHEDRNHLECRSELAGFASCPPLRPANETAGLVCDHLRDNTRRCSTTHDSGVKTSCRMFEVCDQAVLLSGGWNRQTSGPRHVENLRRMFSMLRHHGFKRRNIKVFFANGAPPLRVEGESPQKVFPAALKLAMRNHLRRLCLNPHCVDSLFLYLNSPAASDGSSLLWDLDGDGLATDHERYTVEELKEDLADCEARQVTLVVDQSFSGELVHAFRRSPSHRNLLVFASGKSGEYSFDDEFTRFWSSWNHTRSCSTDIHAASRAALRQSNPRMGEGEEGRVRSTIYGAPCNVRPPFTPRELRHNYFGCQNLPTAVWLRHILRASDSAFLNPDNGDDEEEEENDDEEDEDDDDDDVFDF
ncbi:uncharacterized protein LOC143294272 [Babylonia areolata]|uniref:uncharacterized protein LOC143294272 n=1 Tax=Babylonia areolata TaxID=304850 RepID=UPI003FD5D0C5